jgi:predicted RNA-binding protein YlxR (DUF448 family)
MSSSSPVPERTCIACRQVKPKRELVRLVRVADGLVEVDLTFKKNGRGAYLCRQPQCWEMGLRGRLEHSLKTTLTQESRTKLSEYGKQFIKKEAT